MMNDMENNNNAMDIAVIGMAGRFPGARNVRQFWENLCGGICSITHYTNEELAAYGIESALLNNPHYVKARGEVADIELFDADFFGFSPREAELMDPQHRFLLMCAWEALEDAGYDPGSYRERIGVYAGEAMNIYLLMNVFPQLKAKTASINTLQAAIGNDKDSLTSTIAYYLNLTGPAVTIQSSSSTSLVAAALACQGLLSYNCDMALAGGVAIAPPQKGGYLFEEGSILSPDGYCRAFDASSAGFVPGYGAGLVVLKRMADALADRDRIYAVIKGLGINNDGSQKVSYSAPSVDAQAQVILEAQTAAGVDTETIGYIECHGTGTNMGDPIEVAALTKAFRVQTDKREFCAIGSLKTNIGHLDNAAGVTGLIKAALCCKYGLIPPILHYKAPNPRIDFAASPFYVNTQLREWHPVGFPRRAGVTSLGMGGTNAHMILEQPPHMPPVRVKTERSLILLSAKTESSLKEQKNNIAEFIRKDQNSEVSQAAFTLQTGRRHFPCRSFITAGTCEEAAEKILSGNQVFNSVCTRQDGPVVFLFPGQGALYPRMAESLYTGDAFFRSMLDLCAEKLRSCLGADIRQIIFPPDPVSSSDALYETRLTQPVTFAIEYSLARLWMEWGIKPAAMIGHSIGEYTAACLAGVFSLDDALNLVASRARLMQTTTPGSMLAVGLSAREIEPWLNPGITIALVNAPGLVAVSGGSEDIAGFAEELESAGIFNMRLKTSHAFHSPFMDPILESYADILRSAHFTKPCIPFISGVTGTWITPEQAADVQYWLKQLREPVQFSRGAEEVLTDPKRIFLEVGPGNTLTTLLKQQDTKKAACFTSLPRHDEKRSAHEAILETLGRLWLEGKTIDWHGFYGKEHPYRTALPAYPFVLKRFWIDPANNESRETSDAVQTVKPAARSITDFLYLPVWKQTLFPHLFPHDQHTDDRWLILGQDGALENALSACLVSASQQIVRVQAGQAYEKSDNHQYTINPADSEDWQKLAAELKPEFPRYIVHCWCMENSHGESASDHILDRGYQAIHLLAAACEEIHLPETHKINICIITSGLFEGLPGLSRKSLMHILNGLTHTIPQNYTAIASCRLIDVDYNTLPHVWQKQYPFILAGEIENNSIDPVVVYRNGVRYIEDFTQLDARAFASHSSLLKDDGNYLFYTGFNRSNFLIASHWIGQGCGNLIFLEDAAFFQETDGEKKKSLYRELKLKSDNVHAEQYSVHSSEDADAMLVALTAKYGRINGIIYSPLFNEESGIIHKPGEMPGEWIKEISVIFGMQNLEALDFLLCNSSLSAVLGGIGQADNAAANCYMHSTSALRQQGVNWMCIDWDRIRAEDETDTGPSLSSREACQVLDYVMQVRGASRLVISAAPLEARRLSGLKPLCMGKTSSISGSILAGKAEGAKQIILSIWKEILGKEEIGADDNFYEIGGNSLLILQIYNQLTSFYGDTLKVVDLFNYPTINSLSVYLESLSGENEESGKTADTVVTRIKATGTQSALRRKSREQE